MTGLFLVHSAKIEQTLNNSNENTLFKERLHNDAYFYLAQTLRLGVSAIRSRAPGIKLCFWLFDRMRAKYSEWEKNRPTTTNSHHSMRWFLFSIFFASLYCSSLLKLNERISHYNEMRWEKEREKNSPRFYKEGKQTIQIYNGLTIKCCQNRRQLTVSHLLLTNFWA